MIREIWLYADRDGRWTAAVRGDVDGVKRSENTLAYPSNIGHPAGDGHEGRAAALREANAIVTKWEHSEGDIQNWIKALLEVYGVRKFSDLCQLFNTDQVDDEQLKWGLAACVNERDAVGAVLCHHLLDLDPTQRAEQFQVARAS
jgi:hypothetical protein